jgi:hypothetical protein
MKRCHVRDESIIEQSGGNYIKFQDVEPLLESIKKVNGVIGYLTQYEESTALKQIIKIYNELGETK